MPTSSHTAQGSRLLEQELTINRLITRFEIHRTAKRPLLLHAVLINNVLEGEITSGRWFSCPYESQLVHLICAQKQSSAHDPRWSSTMLNILASTLSSPMRYHHSCPCRQGHPFEHIRYCCLRPGHWKLTRLRGCSDNMRYRFQQHISEHHYLLQTPLPRAFLRLCPEAIWTSCFPTLQLAIANSKLFPPGLAY